jgi:hypothetical protein
MTVAPRLGRIEMRVLLRNLAITAVASSAVFALACGSSADPSACDQYFDAVYTTGCAGPTLPSDELARIRARFEKACPANLSLPGVGTTASGLEACARAIRALGCGGLKADVCTFGLGTLAPNEPCVSDSQCQSGACLGVPAADGGTQGCPVCAPFDTSCPNGAQGTVCGPDMTCIANPTTGAGSCVAITYADAGEKCDWVQTLCKAGLICNGATSICSSPGALGAPCGDAWDCGGSLVCPAAPSTCQNPEQAGTVCTTDQDCAPGLGCGGLPMQTCMSVTWVEPGQACDVDQRCVIGSCQIGNAIRGVCPRPIPDGQPCNPNNPLCDTFAQCVGGTCQLEPRATCP